MEWGTFYEGPALKTTDTKSEILDQVKGIIYLLLFLNG